MLALCGSHALAQGVVPVTENATETAKAATDLLNKIDLLVEHNRQLEKQNQELMEEIDSLRQFLAKQVQPGSQPVKLDTGTRSNPTTATDSTPEKEAVSAASSPSPDPPVTNVAVRGAMTEEQPTKWG
jgi:hypothetical protein